MSEDNRQSKTVKQMSNTELLYEFGGLIEQIVEGIHDSDDPEVVEVEQEILSRMKQEDRRYDDEQKRFKEKTE